MVVGWLKKTVYPDYILPIYYTNKENAMASTRKQYEHFNVVMNVLDKAHPITVISDQEIAKLTDEKQIKTANVRQKTEQDLKSAIVRACTSPIMSDYFKNAQPTLMRYLKRFKFDKEKLASVNFDITELDKDTLKVEMQKCNISLADVQKKQALRTSGVQWNVLQDKTRERVVASDEPHIFDWEK
jgi:hypothetical protein